MSTDYRAELQHLLKAVENDVIDTNDGLRFQAAVNRAHAALAQSEPEGVTDEEIGKCLIAAGVDAMEGESEETNRMYWEGWHEQIITGIRAVITADRARWSRPAIEPVPEVLADDDLPPRVGHVLRLAEIIRKVDGSHGLGAAALAEAILSHPGSRWRPAIEPVPVSERPWEREGWCDLDGECWWGCELCGVASWVMVNPARVDAGWLLPAHVLPIPAPKGCETGTHPV
jgi:hypothetical protein